MKIILNISLIKAPVNQCSSIYRCLLKRRDPPQQEIRKGLVELRSRTGHRQSPCAEGKSSRVGCPRIVTGDHIFQIATEVECMTTEGMRDIQKHLVGALRIDIWAGCRVATAVNIQVWNAVERRKVWQRWLDVQRVYGRDQPGRKRRDPNWHIGIATVQDGVGTYRIGRMSKIGGGPIGHCGCSDTRDTL